MISVGLLVWGVNYIESRRLRRTLQLGIVLSCLVHVVLLIVLYNQRIVAAEQQASEGSTASDSATADSNVVIPDYASQALDESPQDFDKPIEVETPEQVAPTPVARELTQTPDTVRDSPPTPLPARRPMSKRRPPSCLHWSKRPRTRASGRRY